MNADEMKQRTKQFAPRTVKLYKSLPRNSLNEVLGKWLLRSGTSVGGNYRAACRARSRADFVRTNGQKRLRGDEITLPNTGNAVSPCHRIRFCPVALSKTGLVEEEADESACWLESFAESKRAEWKQVAALRDEAVELTAVAAASRKTPRGAFKDNASSCPPGPHSPNRQLR